jgi:Glycosyltransferase family 87
MPLVSRVLDQLALRGVLISRAFWVLGFVFVAFYWLQLTNMGGRPVDARWYWEANPANLYPHPELLEHNGYNYSPAFELVVGWGRFLSFEVFVAIWRALLAAALLWLAGPLTLFVLFTVPVASELNAGNIQLLLAAAIVLGFRGGARSWWPATWAFVLLTKVSPGVGLLWFALRREWRKLAIALGVTAGIAGVSFVLWPDRWFGWVALVTAGSPPPVFPYYWPFWPRFVIAIAIVAVAAWRGWRWPVVVAGCLALPAFYFISPSMLVGVIPFLREAAGRWAKRRLAAMQAREIETLRSQGNLPSDAIVPA